jgi:hypothetical protein
MPGLRVRDAPFVKAVTENPRAFVRDNMEMYEWALARAGGLSAIS